MSQVDIKNFFNSIKSESSQESKEFENLMFILVNEFHWTQKDIADTDLPFVFEVLRARKRVHEEQERQMKKKR